MSVWHNPKQELPEPNKHVFVLTLFYDDLIGQDHKIYEIDYIDNDTKRWAKYPSSVVAWAEIPKEE